MSTTARGHVAEQLAADYLVAEGCIILDRNWRNRFCEIDIVARKLNVVHFVEVKYRATSRYGTPAEFISYDKHQRLVRAALAWSQAHGYDGPYMIDVIAVEGDLALPAISWIESAITS